MKLAISMLLAIMLCLAPVVSIAGPHHSSYKTSSYKTIKIHSYNAKTYGSHKSTSSNKPIYNVGETKYYSGETYKTTGFPKVDRSSSAKESFLKSKGYKNDPQGYEVDHIMPLSKGGKDEPSNMQLLPKEIHKLKTASERK